MLDYYIILLYYVRLLYYITILYIYTVWCIKTVNADCGYVCVCVCVYFNNFHYIICVKTNNIYIIERVCACVCVCVRAENVI